MERKNKYSYLSLLNTFTTLCMFYERVFKKHSGNHNEFKRLFFKQELSILLDKKNRYKNFKILLGILLITFLAIGFSGGSIMYLDKKMNDPFVNFSNIIVPYDLQDSANMIIEEIQFDSILKQQYCINNLTGFSVFDGGKADPWKKQNQNNLGYQANPLDRAVKPQHGSPEYTFALQNIA